MVVQNKELCNPTRLQSFLYALRNDLFFAEKYLFFIGLYLLLFKTDVL